MGAREHVETAIELCEQDRPVLARALNDLLPWFDRPEAATAITPKEAMQEIAMVADTLCEDIASETMRAGFQP